MEDTRDVTDFRITSYRVIGSRQKSDRVEDTHKEM